MKKDVSRNTNLYTLVGRINGSFYISTENFDTESCYSCL